MKFESIHDMLKISESHAIEKRVDFFQHKYKRDREWWVLGRAISLINMTLSESYEYAEATEPPNPDFRIASDRSNQSIPVEIFEVIEDARRRHQQLKKWSMEKNIFRPCHVIDDPFVSFRRETRKKCEKPYPEGTWLLCYLSIPAIQMPDFYECSWSDMVFNEVMTWSNSSELPCFDSSPFSKVYILDSSGRYLVSIHPKLEVIYDFFPFSS